MKEVASKNHSIIHNKYSHLVFFIIVTVSVSISKSAPPIYCDGADLMEGEFCWFMFHREQRAYYKARVSVGSTQTLNELDLLTIWIYYNYIIILD